MLVNGIDLDGLAGDAPEGLVLPEKVQGRTVHIDADFLAYQVSYENVEGAEKSLEDMKHNCEVAVHTLMALAAATQVHLHLTPGTSDKGKRYEIAIQKQYQANRIDKPKPRYLHIIREWMAQKFPATLHQFCEADDGMSAAQYKAIREGKRHLSIIATKDKDLSMVPGLRMDWDTGVITDTETDFGRTWLHERVSGTSGSVTKVLKGHGQSFFWAQMLMGDSADNIQGLPKLPGYVLNIIKPTQQITKAISIRDNPASTPVQVEKAKKIVASRPACAVGPVITYDIMQRVKHNKDAFEFTKSMYESIGHEFGFKHWQTGEEVPWQKVFVSEAQLLWMRRNPTEPLDVALWWKEIQ